MPRVFFYVQHLLGIGHDARAAAITRAMITAGLNVTYVTGGFPDSDFDIGSGEYVALPPLKAASPQYDGLIDKAGNTPGPHYWDQRRSELLAAFHRTAPDILLIETFPFGRWPFREELMPLLDAAAPKCRIICSIRDILEPKSEPRRNTQIVELLDRYFDLILVHGDPQFIPLDRTFQDFPRIAGKVRYTGYVSSSGRATDQAGDSGRDEIIVSAGGGATCAPMMRAAAAAAAQDPRQWRFLLGPNCPTPIRNYLATAPRLIAESVRQDFPQLLDRAAASISQAGYNTTMDILSCATPALMIPHADHGQGEQSLRADRLTEIGRVVVLPEDQLSATSILEGLSRAEQITGYQHMHIDLDGASKSAHLIVSQCVAGN